MEDERYKMIYTKKIDEILIGGLELENNKQYNEIESDNIRILGNDFVKIKEN